MKLLKRENKNKDKSKAIDKSQFLIVGSFLLVLIGLVLLGFKYCVMYSEYQETEQNINKFIYDNTSDIKDEVKHEQKKDEYVAVLQIPKIKLKRGIYPKESSLNNVDKNVTILKESDYPDVEDGNFILVGHSGTSSISYFRYLYKLDAGDKAHVFYNNKEYIYKLTSKYEIEKTGVAPIVRDQNTKTLTLITCKDNSDKQIVLIFHLEKVGG